MSSTKLNTAHRVSIRKNLMSKNSTKEYEVIDKELTQLADDIYAWRMGADAKKINSLPKGWMHSANNFSASIGGDHVRLKMSKERCFPAHFETEAYTSTFAKITAIDPLCDRHRELVGRKKDLEARDRRLEGEINAVLGSATTLEALVKKWPEVKKIAEEVVGKANTCTALAVNLTGLNTALGLVKKPKEQLS